MAHPTPTPTIDRLLNLVPDAPSTVLSQLQSHPELASQQDAHGYSLLHAAASYGHESLLRALIDDFHVDPNLVDEDAETALFSVEEVRLAALLLALGTDPTRQNTDGLTAAEKLADEDEQPTVAAYLQTVAAGGNSAAASSSSSVPTGQTAAAAAATNGDDHPSRVPPSSSNGADPSSTDDPDDDDDDVHPPPPLPDGLQLNVGTMDARDAGDEPDPEFRRRIEELAARPDFQAEAGQQALRDLVMDAVSGLTASSGAPSSSRRRVG